jgi:predicted adenylyl cyclase CyaB
MKIKTNGELNQKMVELKARVNDHDIIRNKLSKIRAEYIGTFHQIDQYFQVPEGRLKLREIKENNTAELIYYVREDILEPKLDEAFILEIQDYQDLKNILARILNLSNVIEKVREIYNFQGTQIHLDTVKNLGKFIEFERKSENNSRIIEKNRKILERLMEKFQIPSENLESHSYNDLVNG